jgi:hypothetical protein
MVTDELDYILGSERPIDLPTGFAEQVMRAVRQEALAPPPIPFPWPRLLIGAASAACLAAAAIVVPFFANGGIAPKLLMSLNSLEEMLAATGLLWFAAGGVISYLSVKLALRTAG